MRNLFSDFISNAIVYPMPITFQHPMPLTNDLTSFAELINTQMRTIQKLLSMPFFFIIFLDSYQFELKCLHLITTL